MFLFLFSSLPHVLPLFSPSPFLRISFFVMKHSSFLPCDLDLCELLSTDESKTFYCKMKGDYYRYLAEFATDDAKSKACEDACFADAEATEIGEKDLVVTHPIRLAVALNSSIFQPEVLQNSEHCDSDFASGVHIGKNDLDVPVVVQRQIPMVQIVQKTKEISQLQCIDKVSDGPVVQVEHIPQSHDSWMLSRKPLKLRRSNSGMWSRSLTYQFCPLWRNWQRPPRFSFRTGLNSVLKNRPSKFLLFHSLRISLRYLSLGRKIKRNTL